MAKEWIRREHCRSCGSSKGLNIHTDGHAFCFSCRKWFKGDKDFTMETEKIINITDKKDLSWKGITSAIPDRRIDEDVVKRYDTVVKKDNENISHHIYKYYNIDGSHIASKIRQVEGKKIWSEGNMSDALLFGQNLFKSGGKIVTVTEGELDAMSVYQMMGKKYPAISIKNGVHSAVENCKQFLEYLQSFDTIVLCFDNDAQGKDATQQVAQLFEPNKCKVMKLTLKDANEYLKMGRAVQFTNEFWQAQPYTPAGIINLKDLGASLYEEEYCETVLFPWTDMNIKTYGMRTGELITFTSGAGMGKSSVMRELMYHIMKNTLDNIGILALEENIKNTAFNIMSVEADARLYIKEVRNKFTREQLEEWQKRTVGTERFFVFDHFGSVSNDEILSRIRYMAKSLDCKWIFLDHLSILVSGQEDGGDERKSIDILMTKLRSLVEETGIGLLLVSHLRRPTGDRGHEEGKEVSLSHLRGSASIAHLSDSVIAMERNQQSEDEIIANTTTIRILKNRYTGETGIACYLHYNKDTGRMTQVDNPFREDTDF
jgi:twinkle protein